MINRFNLLQNKLERSIKWSNKAVLFAKSRGFTLEDNPMCHFIGEKLKIGTVKWAKVFYYKYFYSKSLINLSNNMLSSISLKYGLVFVDMTKYNGNYYEYIIDNKIEKRIKELVLELEEKLHSLEWEYGVL